MKRRIRMNNSKTSFNLVTEPWIQVIDKQTYEDKKVSLIDLFENSENYKQLAGEMATQDLAILRFLLAILTTVYSRVDIDGNFYEWIEGDDSTWQVTEPIDADEYEVKDLYNTWQQLYSQGHFSKAVIKYLKMNQNLFDLFDEFKPFYQVTAKDYDAVVLEKNKLEKNNGQVTVKQINRLISESNNQPAIFSPKTTTNKNKIELDQLSRWLITYQNFSGVTDKAKIKTDEKYSTSAGWLYKLNSVFAKGETLFETLILNLVLVNEKEDIIQKPVWEWDSMQGYVNYRKQMILPDNLAELYTTYSRLLHIKWDNQQQPTIFSAGLPIFDHENAFIEPMTTWKPVPKSHDKSLKPAIKSIQTMNKTMWRNFGDYIKTDESNTQEPGIVSWLKKLKSKGLLPANKRLKLATAVLINDGNVTSQSPFAEITDDLTVKAEVLFDNNSAERWPERIAQIVEVTQNIGNDYISFLYDVAEIRNIDKKQFVSQYGLKFYDTLNNPFKEWLLSLVNDDDRDAKQLEWHKILKSIVLKLVTEHFNSSTTRDIKGIIDDKKNQTKNIFTINNTLMWKLKRDLNTQDKEPK